MIVVNDDLSIYLTRGDAVAFNVEAELDGKPYTFKIGDMLRLKVFAKKNCENVVLQKDVGVVEDAKSVVISLTEEDTKIGGLINKPVDYWYEVELNPLTNLQTIIGYDDDGAKLFRLFPEGKDIEPIEPKPEDIPIVDATLDITSERPIQNRAVASAVATLKASISTLRGDVYSDISNVNSDVKRTRAELATERARITNLATMAEGSTTGDAELKDIRVGADGVTYASAGEAVREQFGAVNETVGGFSNPSVTQNGEYPYYDFKEGYTVGDKIYIQPIEASEAYSIIRVFGEKKGLDTNTQVKLKDISGNEPVVIELQESFEAIRVCWFLAEYSTSFYGRCVCKKLGASDISAITLDNKIKLNVGVYMNSGVVQNGEYPYYDFNGEYNVGDKIYIEPVEANKEYSPLLVYGRQKNDTIETQVVLKRLTNDAPVIIELAESYSTIRVCWDLVEASNDFNGKCICKKLTDDDIASLVFALKESVATLKAEKQFSSFSILGDSYATFKDFQTPDTNSTWYPRAEENNVEAVEQTWWHMFAKDNACAINQNNSYSGSTICYDGYGAGTSDAVASSFVTRCKNLQTADLIIVEGGTNDSWVGVSMGEYKYSGWSEKDFQYFRPSLSYVLNYVKQHHPASTVMFMLNDGLKADIIESVETICSHYDIPLLPLHNIAKESGHPNVEGMTQIKNQLEEFIKALK